MRNNVDILRNEKENISVSNDYEDCVEIHGPFIMWKIKEGGDSNGRKKAKAYSD